MAPVSFDEQSLLDTCNGLLPLLCTTAPFLEVPHSIKSRAALDSIQGSMLGDKRRALTYA